MALRSLDNALPPSIERPKKVPKVVTAAFAPADKKAAALAEAPRSGSCVNDENTAPMPPSERSIEYVASQDLFPLPDPESKIKVLLDELSSKDWMRVCKALNDVRRLAIHHSSLLAPLLGNVIMMIVKSMKNPRSALCKTSIMASSDIFRLFGHELPTSEESAFDQLLLQLLLKASQDKHFVCEEAEKSLETMAICLSPLPLLEKLHCYVNHANLRVRAKTAVAISKCVTKMGAKLVKEFGLANLLRVAAQLLNDRLPEAREAARSIVTCVHAGFSTVANVTDDKSSATESWQNFTSSNLPPISAQAVAKIVSE